MNRQFVLTTLLFFVFLVAFPAIARGGVVINEVAWMGTINSAQDEWMELAGSTGAILDGWKLFTEDGGMSITLSGAMGNAGYFLIERTDDTTVPNVPADFITAFGNGLGNAGEIIILENDRGEEIDRVDGSGSWAIGGSNVTKETLQRASSGWITATGTPRAENKVGSVLTQEPDNNKNKLIGLPETASPKPVPQETAQPQTQDTILVPDRASSSVENVAAAMPHNGSSLTVLILGVVVSVFASAIALLLRRFFT